MSTNYYMMMRNKKIVEKYFPNEYEIVDSPYFGYEIHIGKRSIGWKPLFEEHKHAYESVKEMLSFIEKHKRYIRIFDEYNQEFDIDGLKEELIAWGDCEKEMIHYDDRIGDIERPIDHVEIANREKALGSKEYDWIKYWHDEDGYDFTDRSFS